MDSSCKSCCYLCHFKVNYHFDCATVSFPSHCVEGILLFSTMEMEVCVKSLWQPAFDRKRSSPLKLPGKPEEEQFILLEAHSFLLTTVEQTHSDSTSTCNRLTKNKHFQSFFYRLFLSRSLSPTSETKDPMLLRLNQGRITYWRKLKAKTSLIVVVELCNSRTAF